MLRFIGLLMLTLNVLSEVPSEEERAAIVECHTNLRERVEPSASNMQLMSYSFELEKLAQQLYPVCAADFNESDPKYQNVGIIELTSANDKPRFRDLCKVNSSAYNYDKDKCSGHCINYLQAIWAQTKQIGCALGQCKNMYDPSKLEYYITCIYKPSLLVLNPRPYESGPSCSKCPEGSACHRRQCYDTSSSTQQGTSVSAVFSPLYALICAMFYFLSLNNFSS
uniref:SCP domain-containing protein n=1 Tax=Mesocestoides corti TaxID=53468 RepID=A0A5K3FKQ5_MESCO